MVYFIFDNVELLLEWSGGFRLISSLVRLQEFSRLQNLGVIFVSSLGPDAFFSGTGMLEPLPVYMRDYSDDDLHQILVRRKPDRDLYSSFLR
jgi:origin recognition complex subunit 5